VLDNSTFVNLITLHVYVVLVNIIITYFVVHVICRGIHKDDVYAIFFLFGILTTLDNSFCNYI
jgi:hypothetical protein